MIECSDILSVVITVQKTDKLISLYYDVCSAYRKANIVDSDQTAPKEQSDLGRQCVPRHFCQPNHCSDTYLPYVLPMVSITNI